MGILKAKEPMFPKEAVGPAIVVSPTTDQPYASFHPLFEGLQHAFRPYRRFHPVPLCDPGFSCLFSPLGHLHRAAFLRYVLHASTSLPPFAPSRFRDFLAPMGALTPARLAPLGSAPVHPPYTGQVSLVHMARSSVHSVTNHLTRPTIAFSLPGQRDGLPEPSSPSCPFRAQSGSSQTTSHAKA